MKYIKSKKYKNFKDALKQSKINNFSDYLLDNAFNHLSYDELNRTDWFDNYEIHKNKDFDYIVGYEGSIGIIQDEEIGVCWFLVAPEK